MILSKNKLINPYKKTLNIMLTILNIGLFRILEICIVSTKGPCHCHQKKKNSLY